MAPTALRQFAVLSPAVRDELSVILGISATHHPNPADQADIWLLIIRLTYWPMSA